MIGRRLIEVLGLAIVIAAYLLVFSHGTLAFHGL